MEEIIACALTERCSLAATLLWARFARFYLMRLPAERKRSYGSAEDRFYGGTTSVPNFRLWPIAVIADGQSCRFSAETLDPIVHRTSDRV